MSEAQSPESFDTPDDVDADEFLDLCRELADTDLPIADDAQVFLDHEQEVRDLL